MKTIDPMSIDNMDVVEDWVTEKSDLYSSEGNEKCSNWMQLVQPVANFDDDEDDNDLFSIGICIYIFICSGSEFLLSRFKILLMLIAIV